jgi:hypothetical protein
MLSVLLLLLLLLLLPSNHSKGQATNEMLFGGVSLAPSQQESLEVRAWTVLAGCSCAHAAARASTLMPPHCCAALLLLRAPRAVHEGGGRQGHQRGRLSWAAAEWAECL